MWGPKERVCRRFMTLVECQMPIGNAHLATLGGNGLEAGIWSEMGIPRDHGWLIEINRVRSKSLIARHPYRWCNRLSTFHKIVSGLGETACIDAFHLDLCGTMCDRVVSEFLPALELVLNSTGQCLAITVADQRRNIILETWPHVYARGELLFGARQRDILAALEEQQRNLPTKSERSAFITPFDPHKAIKREFGLMVEVAEMLARYPSWTPDSIERYIYVSRYQPYPFRMRTFLFHFEKRAGTITDFIDRWLTSPLYFDSDGTFVEVQSSQPAIIPEEKGLRMASKLASIVEAIGGAEEAEYKQLVEDRRNFHELLRLLHNTLRLLPERQAAPQPTEVARVEAQPRALNGQHLLRRRNWQQLNEREQIDWLFNTLEAKAQNGSAWSRDVWIQILKKDFGFYSPELGASLRAAIAHTSGAYRPRFEARIRKVFGDDATRYLDRLTRL